MFIEERHRAILDWLKEKGSITTNDIQEQFGVSYDSAKRDLRLLEEKGLLKRTHGGALPLHQVALGRPEKKTVRDIASVKGTIMKVKKVIQEFIIKEEEKPFDSCHASTLIQTKDGVTVAAWFGGSREKGPDVDIWVSRRVNGLWETPVIAAQVRAVAMWNPVLFQKQDGTILLFFKVGAAIPEWKTYVVESEDGGVTFTAPRELVPAAEGP